MTEVQDATGPLAGLLVLDLTRALAGPHATMMLGDQGARVIKVEVPGVGDETRRWGPPFVTDSAGDPQSTYFLSCNRNKESIALDLKSRDGLRTLHRLIERADVLAENFRAGVLDRLGLGVDRLLELNPRLIVLSITGFGHDGPEADRSGYDQIAQGEGGLMSVTGTVESGPVKVGVPIADLLAGMNGAFGVLAALAQRERTGRGTVVRTSLLAGMVGVHTFQGSMYTVVGQVPGPSGQHHPSICPYGLFEAKDGGVQIAIGNDKLWKPFAELFGLDREEWSTNPKRVADREAVIAAVSEAFGAYSRADLIERLTEIGTPAGQVRTIDEVYAWDQTSSQGLLLEVEHATLGPISLPGPVLRYDEGGRTTHAAPPVLGQHTESILEWLNSEKS